MSETKFNKGLYVVVFLLALIGALIGTTLGLFWTRGAKPVSVLPQTEKASGQLSVVSNWQLTTHH
jgi:hypothetical protein